jgi:hypothetical protein
MESCCVLLFVFLEVFHFWVSSSYYLRNAFICPSGYVLKLTFILMSIAKSRVGRKVSSEVWPLCLVGSVTHFRSVGPMVEWWLAGETTGLGEKRVSVHFVHHKSNMDRPGIEPGEKPASTRLSCTKCSDPIYLSKIVSSNVLRFSVSGLVGRRA